MRNCSLISCGILLVFSIAVAADHAPAAESAMAPSTKTFGGQEVRHDDGKLAILVLGAHPDDCEIRAGGTGAMWSNLGHHVKFVSLTNGDIGHWKLAGGPLAKRRHREDQAAAEILGVTAAILDIHDGELMPTLDNRKIVTRLIRQWNADIVIGHRPNDYHPDHRYTGVLMQDSAFMVQVPFFCPDTPALQKNPVFLYSYDHFQLPTPFRPDIVVAIDSVIERKIDALAQMESQFIEGGALGGPESMPQNETDRQAAHDRLRQLFRNRAHRIADRCRDQLIAGYGEEKGKRVQYAEAFEVCEYGRQPSKEDILKLFPFVP